MTFWLTQMTSSKTLFRSNHGPIQGKWFNLGDLFAKSYVGVLRLWPSMNRPELSLNHDVSLYFQTICKTAAICLQNLLFNLLCSKCHVQIRSLWCPICLPYDQISFTSSSNKTLSRRQVWIARSQQKSSSLKCPLYSTMT